MQDIDAGSLRSPEDHSDDPESEKVDKTTTPDENPGGLSALRDDVTALIQDARNYAEAEIAFQKTRAGFAGKAAGRAFVSLVLALVLLHIAGIALAVGAVIALAPFVTIWGAIAIVVGVLLALVAALVFGAINGAKSLIAMFEADDGV